MSYKNINITNEGHILFVKIDRPKFLNALNRETINELGEAFKKANTDADVKVIILTGTGDKAFVAGADITEFNQLNTEEGGALSRDGQEMLFDVVENMSKPVIAAINGFALGGGLELAMACHIRIASDNAKLGLPEVTLGLIPGYGGTQRLAQIAGKGMAFEMITTGQMVSAERSLQSGLVNEVTSLEELIPTCSKLASKILNNSPIAISRAIDAINAAFDPEKDGYETEKTNFGKCFDTKDFREGTNAFLEKRKAIFTGN